VDDRHQQRGDGGDGEDRQYTHECIPFGRSGSTVA
jgi:hypothetical protein